MSQESIAGGSCSLSGAAETPMVRRADAPPQWPESRVVQAHGALEQAIPHIAAAVRLTPKLWTAGGRRYASLWGVAEFSIQEDGTDLRCFPLDEEDEPLVATADLVTPIARMTWPFAFSGILARACASVGLVHPSRERSVRLWLHSSLRRTFKDFVQWNDLRRDLLKWLELDSLTLALHRRIFPGRHARLGTFNWVNAHLRHFCMVAVERPRLLAFLSLVECESGVPSKTLARKLTEGGITPAGRRWMERVGFDPFEQASEYGTLRTWPTTVAQLANRLERLQIEHPSSIFTATAAGDGADLPDWFLLAMHREIERLVDEDGMDEADAVPIGYEEALRWVRSEQPKADPNQRRAGWPWIEAQANKAWLRSILDDPAPWNCPYEAFAQEGLDVIPIRNLLELYEEGVAMRNCLKTFAQDCAEGRMQPFSIRAQGTGQRIGCFMLQRHRLNGPWEVLEVAGPMNAPASDEMNMIAASACERCNERDAATRTAKHRH